METYLQLRFNLIWAARSLLVPSTVGSVSHPSRCRCFGLQRGAMSGNTPTSRMFCLIQIISLPGCPARCSRGSVEGWGEGRETLSRGMDDTLTKSDGAGNLLSPPLQDRRRWGLTANTL